MTSKKRPSIAKAALDAARERAEQARREIGNKPPSELLTPQELADAAPFYFVLREYVRQLKEAREAAGLTLADLSARTGMAVEYLSRLETGAQTNPTWKTLGTYAKALDRRPRLVLEALAPRAGSKDMTAERMEPILRSTKKVTPESDLTSNQSRPNAELQPPVHLELEELVA